MKLPFNFGIQVQKVGHPPKFEVPRNLENEMGEHNPNFNVAVNKLCITPTL
jgi:hypothetical protein